ncbi:MAG: amidohydrolase, partial [Flavobacteriales bacterium]|nr:amidohydrolase [Flavobacteriales bacterium]
MKFKLLIVLLTLQLVVFGQEPNLYPTNGVKHQAEIYYAFTNATIHISYTSVIKGTLLIRNGKVEKVGAIVVLPKGTVEVDLKGKHIYPSFIDMYSSYGQPKEEKKKGSPGPQIESNKKGAFGWNQAIKPEYNSYANFTANDKSAKSYREQGFGTVLSHKMDGISRGTSSLVSLNQGTAGELLLKPVVAAHSSFSKGSSRQSYPSSLMGTIALLRQTHYDADYYKDHRGELPTDLSLIAFQENLSLLQIFEANDKLNIIRADKIGDEFGYQYIFKGKGDEYQRVKEIQAAGGAIIIPLNFPKPYDVSDPYSSRLVSLAQMKHWELAPGNAKALADHQIQFAFTLNGLKKKSEFWKNIRKTVARGLSADEALKALTTTPAILMGVEHLVGELRPSMLANFLVTSGEIFEEKTIIYDNWIQGDQYILNPKDVLDVRGTYRLKVEENDRTLKVAGTLTAPKASIEYDVVTDSISKSGDLVLDEVNHKPIKTTKKKKVKGLLTVKDQQVSLSYKIGDEFYALSGVIHSNSGIWEGKGTLPNGVWVKWAAVKKSDYKDKSKKKPMKMDTMGIGQVTYPMLPYGWDSLPTIRQILIKDA